MAKDPKEKEKQDNPTTPGAGLSKSEETKAKLEQITGDIEKITGKAQIGITYLMKGKDMAASIKKLINRSEEEAYKAKQEIKQQAKDKPTELIYSYIPTKQEIIDYLEGHSCNLLVIQTVKETKTILEDGLNFGKDTINSVISKLEKIQAKITKAADNITLIAVILGIFQALIIAFEILVTALKLAINFFTSLMAAAGPEKIINDLIAKGTDFILKYTEIIKGFTKKCLKVLGIVMIIFDLIPKVISFFNNLLNVIENFLTLIATLWRQYIARCIPAGDLIIDNGDGTQTVNDNLLDKFINTNLNNEGSGNFNPYPPNTYNDYIYDTSEKQHRIYKPKLPNLLTKDQLEGERE
jgi:hypothetical protein